MITTLNEDYFIKFSYYVHAIGKDVHIMILAWMPQPQCVFLFWCPLEVALIN